MNRRVAELTFSLPQHPPSAIQPLFDSLTPETPLSFGTRYGEGVSMSEGWPLHRRIISWGARQLARPLTSVSDPMTGFFAVTKEHVRRQILLLDEPPLTFLSSQLQTAQPINPSGFKIALEVLLKAPSPAGTYPEVAYSFGVRTVGASKLGAKVMLKYVGQLLSLYVWAFGIWFHLFVAVAVTLGVRILDRIWQERKRYLTRDKQYPLGGFHPNGGIPPLSPKAVAKNKPSLTNRGGGGGAGQGSIAMQSLTGGGNGGWGGAAVKEKKRFV